MAGPIFQNLGRLSLNPLFTFLNAGYSQNFGSAASLKLYLHKTIQQFFLQSYVSVDLQVQGTVPISIPSSINRLIGYILSFWCWENNGKTKENFESWIFHHLGLENTENTLYLQMMDEFHKVGLRILYQVVIFVDWGIIWHGRVWINGFLGIFWKVPGVV